MKDEAAKIQEQSRLMKQALVKEFEHWKPAMDFEHKALSQ